MPKIKVKIDNTENIVDYTIDSEVINYKELDNTNTYYDLNNNILIRDNDDLHMIYDFNNKKGTILIKEFDREVEVLIDNIDIERNKNNVRVSYSIENRSRFIDLVENGLQIKLSFAIDYTNSNLVYTNPNSLHYIGNPEKLNPYENCLPPARYSSFSYLHCRYNSPLLYIAHILDFFWQFPAHSLNSQFLPPPHKREDFSHRPFHCICNLTALPCHCSGLCPNVS